LKKVLSQNKYKLVGLDTNIFIYHFRNDPQFMDKTDLIFKFLEDRRVRAVTSIITIAELQAFRAPEKVLQDIRESFLSTPNLITVDVNQEIALASAEIRREYKFALADAIQLATAIDAKAQTFITNDKRLKLFKRLPVTLLTEI